jgi:hypothetical protein
MNIDVSKEDEGCSVDEMYGDCLKAGSLMYGRPDLAPKIYPFPYLILQEKVDPNYECRSLR